MFKIILLGLAFITLCGFGTPNDNQIMKDEVLTIKEPKVEWMGKIVFSNPYSGVDPGFYGGNPPPSILTDQEIEIGLREDGVVVWRKKDK